MNEKFLKIGDAINACRAEAKIVVHVRSEFLFVMMVLVMLVVIIVLEDPTRCYCGE